MQIAKFEKINSLKCFPYFSNLEDSDLTYLLSSMHFIETQKNQVLINQYDKAHYIYLNLHGVIKLSRFTSSGEEILVKIIGPLDSFGEAVAIATNASYPVRASSVCQGAVVRWDFSKFQANANSRLLGILVPTVLNQIAQKQKQHIESIEQIKSFSVAQRLAHFFLFHCKKIKYQSEMHWKVILPYEKSLVCGLLGLKPETFSRTIQKMSEFGITRINDEIFITDIDLLKNYENNFKQCRSTNQ